MWQPEQSDDNLRPNISFMSIVILNYEDICASMELDELAKLLFIYRKNVAKIVEKYDGKIEDHDQPFISGYWQHLDDYAYTTDHVLKAAYDLLHSNEIPFVTMGVATGKTLFDGRFHMGDVPNIASVFLNISNERQCLICEETELHQTSFDTELCTGPGKLKYYDGDVYRLKVAGR